MSLFSPKIPQSQTSTKILGYQAQTSIYGRPIPWVFGRNITTPNVIWYGDWKATPVPQTGGKGGGGKGASGGKGGTASQQFAYNAAIEMGLCAGPINGLGYIWNDRVRLTLNGSTEPYTVPGGGGDYAVLNAANYQFDRGSGASRAYSVTANDYGSPGSVTLTGNHKVALKRVLSSPGLNEYSVDEGTGTYTFGAAMAGVSVVVSYTWSDPNSATDGNPVGSLSLTLFDGSAGQSPWGFLTTNHPDQALGYSRLAYVANESMDLGQSGLVSNYRIEVFGPGAVGGGISDDCNPADVIALFLSDPVLGCSFPSASIGDLTPLRTYCQANGLFISPVVDSQQSADTWLAEWLMVANSQPVWSDGILKFRPYADKTAVGNGLTFTPDTAPVYDLDSDDFIGSTNIISSSRTDIRDAYNSATIEWSNRGNDYKFEPLEDKDNAAIRAFGYRPASSITAHSITTQPVAQKVASILKQRSLYIRNTYTFKLSAVKYSLLEPMDLVTITKAEKGLTRVPVRITSIEEDDGLILNIEAEEFPWGTASPTLNPKQSVGPFGPDYFRDPGFVTTPLFFEPTSEMTQGIQHELMIALSGGPDWGGCNVYASTDGGTSYSYLGTQTGPSKKGELTSSFPFSVDPDNTHTLSVDLTESLGALESFTAGQEDAFIPLAIVNDELISYRTATLTGPYHYDITHTRRGVYRTGADNHSSGEAFAFVDAGLFSWIYDDANIGQTVKFKFVSFNRVGQQEQELSALTAYDYEVKGPRPGDVTIGSITEDETDPGGSVRLTVPTTPPDPTLNFRGVDIWVMDVTSGHVDHPRLASTLWLDLDGSFPQDLLVTLQRPATGDEDWKFWLTSYSDATHFKPITSGVDEDPHFTVTVHQFTPGTLPPASDPSAVSGTAVYSGDDDGNRHFGIEVDIDPDTTVGWADSGSFLVQAEGPMGTSDQHLVTLFEEKSVPTGHTHYQSKPDISFYRPAFADDELWRVVYIGKNADGKLSDPVYSSNFTVVGGGGNTPAPDPTSIVDTINYLDDGTFTVTAVATFNTSLYVYVNQMFWKIRYYNGTTTILLGANPIGTFNPWDFDPSLGHYNATTGEFTFTHGPYGRPDADQKYATEIATMSGNGNINAPTAATPTTVTTVSDSYSTTGIKVTGLTVTRNSPVNYSSDGLPLMQFTANFTNPTDNTLAYSIRPTVINVDDSSDTERVTGMDHIIKDEAGFGNADSIGFGPWQEFIGHYKLTFYTVNAAGDIVDVGTPPSVTVAITTASPGKIDFTRFNTLTVNAAKFAVSAGKFTIATGGIVSSDISSVSATTITGSIIAAQIGSVAASTITGTIISSQIGSVAASTITGSIVASQIGSVNATAITGTITSGQIASVAAGSITGSITSGQIGSVAATTITGVIVTSQLTDQILSSLRLVSTGFAVIERVSSLPTLPNTAYPVNCSVLLTTTGTLYNNVSNTWQATTASSTVSGHIQSTDITSVSAGTIVGLIVAAQIQTITAGQITGSIVSSQIGSVAASTITGSITSSQISSVSASSITGTITSSQIGSVNATAITGTIIASQIGSLNGAVINVGTVGPTQISSVNAGQLNAGTINVSLTLNAATINSPVIVVSGGSFTVNINTTDGVKVTNSTNSSTVTLQPGYVSITGTGSLTGNTSVLQPGDFILAGSSSTQVNVSCALGIARMGVTRGANSMGMSIDSTNIPVLRSVTFGANISITGGGNFVDIGGEYRVNGITLIDGNRLHRFNSNQWNNSGGSMPGSYSKTLFIYDQNGGFVGSVPIL